MTPLLERQAVLTGAAAGIGLGIARELLAQGATVHGIDRDAAGLRLLAQEFSGRFIPYVADLADRDATDRMLGQLATALAGRCDIVLIAEDARVSFPEIPHGIPPTIVLSYYRYVLPRNLLGDLIYTGRELNGFEAVQAGLAARAVAESELDALALKMAKQVAGYDRRSIALVKDFLARTENMTPAQAPGLGISLYANEISHRAIKR